MDLSSCEWCLTYFTSISATQCPLDRNLAGRCIPCNLEVTLTTFEAGRVCHLSYQEDKTPSKTPCPAWRISEWDRAFWFPTILSSRAQQQSRVWSRSSLSLLAGISWVKIFNLFPADFLIYEMWLSIILGWTIRHCLSSTIFDLPHEVLVKINWDGRWVLSCAWHIINRW